jgi:hypothetical protein
MVDAIEGARQKFPGCEFVLVVRNEQGAFIGMQGVSTHLMKMCEVAMDDIRTRAAKGGDEEEHVVERVAPGTRYAGGLCQLWQDCATHEHAWLVLLPKEDSAQQNQFLETSPRFNDILQATVWGLNNLSEDAASNIAQPL